MPREFPLVIRETGEKFIPTFPVELEAGDQLIIVREIRGSRVPKGHKWVLDWEVSGYASSGPIVTEL